MSKKPKLHDSPLDEIIVGPDEEEEVAVVDFEGAAAATDTTESAVEENKLYMDDDFSVLVLLRISLSSGSSFIMFMIFVNKNNIV